MHAGLGESFPLLKPVLVEFLFSLASWVVRYDWCTELIWGVYTESQVDLPRDGVDQSWARSGDATVRSDVAGSDGEATQVELFFLSLSLSLLIVSRKHSSSCSNTSFFFVKNKGGNIWCLMLNSNPPHVSPKMSMALWLPSSGPSANPCTRLRSNLSLSFLVLRNSKSFLFTLVVVVGRCCLLSASLRLVPPPLLLLQYIIK